MGESEGRQPLGVKLERETGIEPATNSLEGCDSTTELLPHFIAGSPQRPIGSAHHPIPSADRQMGRSANLVAREGFEPSKPHGRQIYSLLRLTASLPRRYCCCRARPLLWQAPAGERASSKARCADGFVSPHLAERRQAVGIAAVLSGFAPFANVPAETGSKPLTVLCSDGAGEGIRTPDRLITNQLLYRTELRQPRQKSICSTGRATLASGGE